MKINVITVLIAGLSLCVVGIMGYSYCTLQSEHINHKYYDINEYLKVEEYDNGTIGIVNKSTGKKVGCYDQVLSFENMRTASVLIVVKDGLRGYISAETGESVFTPQFLYAWKNNSNNNLAACVNTEGKMGFVNVTTKEIAIPFQYDFDENIFCPYGEPIFDFVFNNGLCIVPNSQGLIGLINETGELVLPIEYSDIINWRDAKTPEIILKRRSKEDNMFKYSICDRHFNMVKSNEYESLQKLWTYNDDDQIEIQGYIVSYNKRYGLLNKSFDTILQIEYDNIYEIDSYKHGIEGVVAVKNYTPRLYDLNGTLLNEFYVEPLEVYDTNSGEYVEKPGFTSIPEPFNGGSSGYIQYHICGLYGVIDGEKRIVLPAIYSKIDYLGHGNFACLLNDITFLERDNKIKQYEY